MVEGPKVEIKWTWRRWVTIGLLLVGHAGIGFVVWQLSTAMHAQSADPVVIAIVNALMWIALALALQNTIVQTGYLTGSTVTDWARVGAAIRGNSPDPAPAPPTPPHQPAETP